ncbi:uncharacterized protein EMH_0033170 [Eimeria mitis]|uniref:Uncharacterized protein n=1 Tax=Eimeria mitis TaxID=44415 RepID=U6JQ09_9EIME|nr:uncharacterized protein EMH_0033170 [Eimeria mitis]CDJ27595.1 hypothetical protein EMH_0033170 [Eimeria mitis]
MESLAANCSKSISDLLQVQERCLDRLAVYALFPGKEERQLCSTLLAAYTEDQQEAELSGVSHFVVRVIQTLTEKGNAFNSSPASAHLFWKGNTSPLIMLMTWDAQLHVAAVERLLEKHPISNEGSGNSHPGSICFSGLYHQVVLARTNTGSPVIPDILQLAHTFAVACLLLLTGRASAFTATPLFPFVMELLDDDIWEEDTFEEARTTPVTIDGSSASEVSTSHYWVQYIQRFLIKWWIGGSGEAQISRTQKHCIRQTFAENEISMFQVVAYLSAFVRPLRSFLQQSLVLLLCLNGNLNTAIRVIRRFGNTVLPPQGVQKFVEISHYLSSMYPSPIRSPPNYGRDGDFGISVGSMGLSVATGLSACKSCSPSCEMFLGVLPRQHPPSAQRYLAERIVTPSLPKEYIRDLGGFLLRASTAMRQQLSMEL